MLRFALLATAANALPTIKMTKENASFPMALTSSEASELTATTLLLEKKLLSRNKLAASRTATMPQKSVAAAIAGNAEDDAAKNEYQSAAAEQNVFLKHKTDKTSNYSPHAEAVHPSVASNRSLEGEGKGTQRLVSHPGVVGKLWANCTHRNMRAYIINGRQDGTVELGRWPAANQTCQGLGFECVRSPAVFTDMRVYKEACGQHTEAESIEKYKRGCMFAQKLAFQKIAQGISVRGSLSEARGVIFEDDIALPGADSQQVCDTLSSFLSGSATSDVAYIGHCGRTHLSLCMHALALTPDGARKALELVNWCSAEPVDKQIKRLCKSGMLSCAYAHDMPNDGLGSYGGGIIKQKGEAYQVQEWFHEYESLMGIQEG